MVILSRGGGRLEGVVSMVAFCMAMGDERQRKVPESIFSQGSGDQFLPTCFIGDRLARFSMPSS